MWPEESCYLCGATTDLTDDHVPAANLFAQMPPNPIKVRACKNCNGGHSLDDEAFRVFVCSAAQTEEGKTIFKEGVIGSSFARSKKLEKIVREYMQQVLVATSGGYQLVWTLGFPKERAEKVLTQITKGLLRKFYPGYDYRSDEFKFICKMGYTNDGRNTIGHLLNMCSFVEQGIRTFRCWHLILPDTGAGGVWIYQFYDSWMCFVFHKHNVVTEYRPPQGRRIVVDGVEQDMSTYVSR